MSRSQFMRSAICLGAAFAAAVSFASPAMALDAGKCYSAEQVTNETWKAEGEAKHYTLVMGDRTIPTRPKNLLTSTRSGDLGYNIEVSTDGKTMCIGAKYTDIQVNTSAQRPTWVSFPKGSENDRYMSVQEREFGTRILMTGRSIVHVNGEDYYGDQIVVTKSDRLVEGFNGGSVFTNNQKGSGEAILAMMNVSTNPDLVKFAENSSPRTQTDALALK